MKQTIIKCPKCGQSYLIEEIFMPEDILGNPHNIIKNDTGEIEYYDGTTGKMIEDYICDKCGCHFRIEGEMICKTKEIVKPVFEEEYVTKIYKDRIKLEEPK